MMRSVLSMVCLIVLVAAGCAQAQSTTSEYEQMEQTLARLEKSMTVIFTDDLEKDPAETGWELIPATKRKGVRTHGTYPIWNSTTAASGKHCIKLRDGHIESPLIPIEPFGYYMLSFNATTDSQTLWAVQFFDTDGNRLMSDHYSCFDPSLSWDRKVFCFKGRARATHARIRFTGGGYPFAYIDDLKVGTVSKETVAAWSDAVYTTVPKLDVVHQPGWGARIPKALRAIRNKGNLKVVMLGDSIINDTANSHWDCLVERAFPGCRLDVVSAVRGGTGCWYYKDENRMQSFVFDHKPDLLIIGGISQRNSVEDIRNCVKQAKAAMPELEIMVMSGAVGRTGDPRVNPDEWPDKPEKGSYRYELAKMAAEEDIEYFDFRKRWADYIRTSGRRYDYFGRDVVHANHRGRTILGRILLQYFGGKE